MFPEAVQDGNRKKIHASQPHVHEHTPSIDLNQIKSITSSEACWTLSWGLNEENTTIPLQDRVSSNKKN